MNADIGGSKNSGLAGISKMEEGYKSILSSRYNNANPTAKAVFDKYSSKTKIRDSNYPSGETAHYSPNVSVLHPRGIYFNAADDKNNPRGAGTTYYHELGHMIDHASTGFNGFLSDTSEFKDALVSDANNFRDVYNKLEPREQSRLMNLIRSDSFHSFSDLIDGLTDGEICGSYGHEPGYFNRPGSIQSEAFAHFFEASMGSPYKQQIFQTFFPKAFSHFNSVLGSLL